MGPARSLHGLLDVYKTMEQRRSEKAQEGEVSPVPPTTSWTTISIWSTDHSWVARAKAWDRIAVEIEKTRWEQQRESLRTRRLELMERMLARAEEAVDRLATSRRMVPLGEMAGVMNSIVNQLRVETGDATVQGKVTTPDGETAFSLELWLQTRKERLEKAEQGTGPE